MTERQSPHNAKPFPTLDVGRFDAMTDTIVIEGTKFSGELFRGFAMVGHVLRIEKRAEDGVVTVTRLYEKE